MSTRKRGTSRRISARSVLRLLFVSLLVTLVYCDKHESFRASSCTEGSVSDNLDVAHLSPESQCRFPTIPPTPAPEPSFSPLRKLFGGAKPEIAFLSKSFERSALHISHSTRADRQEWLRYYRRLVPAASLTSLLSSNQSAIQEGKPLQLHDDIDILRPTAEPQRRENTASEDDEDEDDGYNENGGGNTIPGWGVLANIPVNLPTLRSALFDGGVLALHHAQRRSRAVSELTDALQSYFRARARARVFVHGEASGEAVPTFAPTFSGSERFVVIVSGTAEASVVERMFAFPGLGHVMNNGIRQAAWDRAAESVQKHAKKIREKKKHRAKDQKTRRMQESPDSFDDDDNLDEMERSSQDRDDIKDGDPSSDDEPFLRRFQLDEGDVLYVPRGAGLDIRTEGHRRQSGKGNDKDNGHAVLVEVEVDTGGRTGVDGIVAAVGVARRALGSKLDESVAARGTENTDDDPSEDENESEGKKSDVGDEVTWADVVNAAARVAGEFTPMMRRFVSAGGDAMERLEEAGRESGIDTLQDVLERFVAGASGGQHTLFEPIMEVLASDQEEVEAVAGRGIAAWARVIWKEGGAAMKHAGKQFLACMKELGSSDVVAIDAVNALAVEWGEAVEMKRDVELREREDSIRRHEAATKAAGGRWR